MDAFETAAVQRARAALNILAKPGELGLSNRDVQRYRLFRAVQSAREGDRRKCFEYECSEAIRAKNPNAYHEGTILVPTEVLGRPLGDAAARAMSTTPGDKGGYLVGAENLGFVDVLRARSVVSRLGGQFVGGLTGNASLARSTGTVTVTWQAGDGTSVTATDQSLGQLSFTPRTAVAITDVSEQHLNMGGELAERFFTADLARATAVAVDKAALVGAGGAEPLGISKQAAVLTQDAATATYAKILAFPKAAAAANAGGAFGFVAAAAGAEILAQRFINGTGSRPVWDGALTDGECVGYPAMSSEQLASGNLIFGAWDDVVVADWGVLELSTSRGGTRFNAVLVGIRALWMVDVVVRHPASFVVSANLS